ncbi:hypothetical protein AAV98_16605 [Bacillus sp. CHD6a]|nr:hypothetical protein AAV98_16605 [Bacillus sp. CHD6a]
MGGRDGLSLTVFAFGVGVWAERGGSLLPFLIFEMGFGRREPPSLTVFAFAAGVWAQRRALSYRFCFCSLGFGAETPSLLPFLLLELEFGGRDGLSLTVFAFAAGFWVERHPLSYRFCFRSWFLGEETPSLLPFLLSQLVFGRREPPSLTVFAFASGVSAESPPLSYRFCFHSLGFGGENHSFLK